jgi:hypothetical protein
MQCFRCFSAKWALVLVSSWGRKDKKLVCAATTTAHQLFKHLHLSTARRVVRVSFHFCLSFLLHLS